MLLEHHAAVGAWPADRRAVEAQGAARGLQKAGDQVEEGRLAAAARADHGDELRFGDAQREVGERYGAVAVAGVIEADVLGDELDAHEASSSAARICALRRRRPSEARQGARRDRAPRRADFPYPLERTPRRRPCGTWRAAPPPGTAAPARRAHRPRSSRARGHRRAARAAAPGNARESRPPARSTRCAGRRQGSRPRAAARRAARRADGPGRGPPGRTAGSISPHSRWAARASAARARR